MVDQSDSFSKGLLIFFSGSYSLFTILHLIVLGGCIITRTGLRKNSRYSPNLIWLFIQETIHLIGHMVALVGVIKESSTLIFIGAGLIMFIGLVSIGCI